jgi:hypothetical protein
VADSADVVDSADVADSVGRVEGSDVTRGTGESDKTGGAGRTSGVPGTPVTADSPGCPADIRLISAGALPISPIIEYRFAQVKRRSWPAQAPPGAEPDGEVLDAFMGTHRAVLKQLRRDIRQLSPETKRVEFVSGADAK